MLMMVACGLGFLFVIKDTQWFQTGMFKFIENGYVAGADVRAEWEYGAGSLYLTMKFTKWVDHLVVPLLLALALIGRNWRKMDGSDPLATGILGWFVVGTLVQWSGVVANILWLQRSHYATAPAVVFDSVQALVLAFALVAIGQSIANSWRVVSPFRRGFAHPWLATMAYFLIHLMYFNVIRHWDFWGYLARELLWRQSYRDPSLMWFMLFLNSWIVPLALSFFMVALAKKLSGNADISGIEQSGGGPVQA